VVPKRISLIFGGVLLACVGCSPSAPIAPGPAPTSSGASTVQQPLRTCVSLVGKPAYAAIIGLDVTCGFGGTDTRSHRVSVAVEKCPDTSPFYVFYSTAPDAVDRDVYYGSEASPLFATTHAKSNVTSERQTVCGHGTPTQ
jgi:hypothetical protein